MNTKELKLILEQVRTFIEYARYELEPGEPQQFDQFPRQCVADEQITKINKVIMVIDRDCAFHPEFRCDRCPGSFCRLDSLRDHILFLHRKAGEKFEFCENSYCPGDCEQNGECPGECC